jgi:hypothetical protein
MKSRVTILVAVLALCACESAPTVRSNADNSVDLSSYHTWSFVSDPGTNREGYSTPITGYFKDAIRKQMEARGYRYVEDPNPDLLVNFGANARENVDVRSSPAPTYGYYGYRRGLYGGIAVESSPDIETVRYKVGTANVDVVDAKARKVVWEGVAEGRLTDKVMKDPRTAIDSAITEMFSKFPARAAGS